MPFDLQRARPLLQSFHLPNLFVDELGWEPCRKKLSLCVGEIDYTFTALAEKRGFIAWCCESPDGGLPNHTTRLKLDRKLSETSYEHLIVFVTHDRSKQSWVWVRREVGKLLIARTHDYHCDQPGDSLLQKIEALYVSLEEEDAGLSTVVVAGRARAAFDIERVTKAFYRDFSVHRIAFLKFIDGISEVSDREWYVSVMLNRLMFIYFIQRKGFLDGDHNYLRNRLVCCKKGQGKDKFYSFYRYFLLRLFHEGFGKRRKDRAPDLERLLGNIPYLNGGLFDVHELEKSERYGKDIQISDRAFERIFDYFDQYQWHLDERPLRADNEINPDVLGYIFEKYINQKQMGAYYTKEDITEYISKNTVLPFLFDAACAKCKVAFENPDGPTVWELLRENPDRYIYDAVKKGVSFPLPPEIAIGLDTTKPDLIERRKAWNKTAPSEYALPTETWREVVARRQRYEEVKKKLTTGGVRSVNDFITLNLDLRQFTQDVLQDCEGPDLLIAFWQAITTITVLDPTGGSGAFIFAALNILEPLYEGCLDRMEAFLAEWGEAGKKFCPNYYKKFTEVLARVDVHPNRRYFVLKSIILSNLYAVDIMEEAVEICKLRLFLKLVAQVEPDAERENFGIEPLPDIDFNIRAGNTLVGYATTDQVRRCMKVVGDQMKLMTGEDTASFDRFNKYCTEVEVAFREFRNRQIEGDGSMPAVDKLELKKRLKSLEDELNRHLAGEYGVKVGDKATYAKWLKSHQPFHWFIQFYGILNSGGFDVILGNPPYVEYKDVRGTYVVKNCKTEQCSNLFAFVLERCITLSHTGTEVGMIVPLSAFSTDRMIPLMLHIKENSGLLNIANFSWRPGKLFDGVNLQLSILLQKIDENLKSIETTRYLMWDSVARQDLFSKIEYTAVEDSRLVGSIPKLGTCEANSVLTKLRQHKKEISGCFTTKSNNRVFYRRGGLYWKVFVDFKTGSSEEKVIHVLPQVDKYAIIAALSSDLWWWYFTITSDCRHLGNRDIGTFPFDPRDMDEEALDSLCYLGSEYVTDLKRNAKEAVRVYKGTNVVDCLSFRVNQSKPIIDEIDTVLARHYGFTAEELDFILNYDIKYRLGRGVDGEKG
jgi:hypothetical protein